MKHSTLFFTLALISACSLNATASPTFKWSKIVDSPEANDQNGGIVTTSDGNFVSYNSFQSSGSDSPCYFGSDIVANGSATDKNRNLLVLKNDANGNKLWTVYSRNGYTDASDGGITATADGGVLVLLKIRPTSSTPYKAMILVDAAGDETELYDMNTSILGYTQAILKINATGHIEWVRTILADQLPVPAASTSAAIDKTTDAVNPSAICTDPDGNIYVGGNYRAPIIYSNANNGCFVLTARNVATYNGDPQRNAGGLYIVKLDNDGYYLSHIKPEGINEYENIKGLSYADGNIVFNGTAKGCGTESSLTIGDKSFSMADDTSDGLFIGSVKASDLSCNYLKRFKTYLNSSNKFVLQVKNSFIAGNKLYVLGAINGGLGEPDTSTAAIATEGTMLEAFALQINAADGSIERSRCEPGKTITGYYGGFVYENKVYFQGYTIMKDAFIDSYPVSGSWTDNTRMTFLTGSVGMANGAAIDNTGTAVFSTRINGKATLSGTDTTPETTGYGTVLTSYNLGTQTGISDTITDNSGTTFTGGKGNITVTSPSGTIINIYSLNGIYVTSVTVPAGTSHIELDAGIYIANGNKVIVR